MTEVILWKHTSNFYFPLSSCLHQFSTRVYSSVSFFQSIQIHQLELESDWGRRLNSFSQNYFSLYISIICISGQWFLFHWCVLETKFTSSNLTTRTSFCPSIIPCFPSIIHKFGQYLYRFSYFVEPFFFLVDITDGRVQQEHNYTIELSVVRWTLLYINILTQQSRN